MIPEVVLTVFMIIISISSLIGLPGPLLNSIIISGYAYLTGFREIDLILVFIYILLGVFGIVVDNLFSIAGAKKFGASKAGTIGAFIGTLSVFFIGPLGIIVGPFAGAFAGETLFAKKTPNDAAKASIGAVIGFLTGTLAKMALALLMTVSFIFLIFY